ncbi:hypothetical protein DSECCO2_399590 [anaerobic digester metagenome]
MLSLLNLERGVQVDRVSSSRHPGRWGPALSGRCIPGETVKERLENVREAIEGRWYAEPVVDWRRRHSHGHRGAPRRPQIERLSSATYREACVFLLTPGRPPG